MSWLRVDDKFHMSGKWLALEHDPLLWAACVSLWTMAGSWLSQSGEAHIQLAQLYKLCPLPREQVRAAADALVDQARKPGSDYGLWERVGDGLYAFHDWHEYRGKSSAERVAEHRKRKAAQPEFPAVSPSNADVTRVTLQPVTHETAVTVTLDPARGSRPDPTRPDPTQSRPDIHTTLSADPPRAQYGSIPGEASARYSALYREWNTQCRAVAGSAWKPLGEYNLAHQIRDALNHPLCHKLGDEFILHALAMQCVCAAERVKRNVGDPFLFLRKFWDGALIAEWAQVPDEAAARARARSPGKPTGRKTSSDVRAEAVARIAAKKGSR